MTSERYALTVLGAGSYGTALAMAASSKGEKVLLWARNPEKAARMCAERENSQYLAGLKFPPELKVSSDLKECVSRADTVLVVVPSHSFADMMRELKPLIRPGQGVAWATKGLERGTGELLSVVAQRELGRAVPLAALSGPTFARELAGGLPTAISIAGTEPDFIRHMCDLMHTPSFRVYECHDLIALQLGGAVKNVIAIGCGMSDGLGYGANARTALISRGLAEMERLGLAMGATDHGFMGLSGLGDLVLTCTDNQSRNRRFGFMLGRGISAQQALKEIGQVVEGYLMTEEIVNLASRLNVSMPICTEIFAVLYQGKSGREAAKSLLGRGQTAEY